jgi:hypothetical protein
MLGVHDTASYFHDGSRAVLTQQIACLRLRRPPCRLCAMKQIGTQDAVVVQVTVPVTYRRFTCSSKENSHGDDNKYSSKRPFLPPYGLGMTLSVLFLTRVR